MSETSTLLPNSAPASALREPTRSAWYLALLALPIGGLQVAWSVEISAGSSYLLSLGISKQLLALVWLAGPLMGILVQPYVGALSDNCRISWGRRRPYLLGGTVVTILSMTGLAWVRELTGAAGGPVKAAAAVGVYALNFGLNVVEAASHAFITDCAPRHQQEAANGMASRGIAVGGLVGFLAGSLDLAAYLPFLGDSHFKVLCSIASSILCFTVLVGAGLVAEEDPNERYNDSAAEKSIGGRLWGTLWGLSPQIKTLFAVQLFACFAFFPIVFYASVYVAEIYAAPYLRENPHMTPAELDVLYDEGTRKGATALAWNGVVMLVSTILAPALVTPTYDRARSRSSSVSSSRSSASSETLNNESSIPSLQMPRFTLKRAWIASLVLQALALLGAPMVHSVDDAVVLVAALGYTWALSAWAPFAIIGAETHAGPDTRTSDSAGAGADGTDPSEAGSGDGVESSSMRNQVGVVLGIHNVVVCTAQAMSTVVSLGIFGVFQKPRGQPGDVSLAVLLGVSGLAGVLAVCFATRIREPGRRR